MKNYFHIILSLLFLFSAIDSAFSQRPDSTRVQKKNETTAEQTRQDQLQNREQSRNNEGQQNQLQARQQGSGAQQGNIARNESNQGVKQIKSARPDMSKARGARPPAITRPSGSQIPKGIGKPGGAARRGGR